VGEDGEQPSLGISSPTVDHRQRGDRARRRFWSGCMRSADGLQLTAGRAVDDVPPGGSKLFADRVSGFEIASLTALNALGEKALGLGSIRSSWL